MDLSKQFAKVFLLRYAWFFCITEIVVHIWYHTGMKTITHYILPVVAGFIAASIIMMVFESINSLIYPFPEGMNTRDLVAVRAFADTLPATAFILVFLGWAKGAAVGTWLAGLIARYFGAAGSYRATALPIAIILSLAGILNQQMFQFPIWTAIVGTALFFAFSYLGWKWGSVK